MSIDLTGLMGYWDLSESGSTARADLSGRGNHLTAVNSPPNIDGKIGKAFDNMPWGGPYLSHAGTVADGADFRFTNESFTFGCWFYPDSQNYDWSLGKRKFIAFGPGAIDWGFRNPDDPAFSPSFQVGILWAPGSGGAWNQWNLLIGRWNQAAKTLSCFVNDVKSDQSYPAGSFSANDAPFWLGTGDPGNVDFGCHIDDTWLFRRALTDQECSAIWNGGDGLTWAQWLAVPAKPAWYYEMLRAG